MKIILQIIISIMVLLQVSVPFQVTAQIQKPLVGNFPEPSFEHLTIEDGLPENSVRCILQDHLGYMWFGTQTGLVRYDGYNMKVYQPDPNDSLSISDGQIINIFEEHNGTLWVGTLKGLNKFDRNTDTFTRYMHNPDNSASLSSNFVWTIYEDKEGSLFIGTDKSLDLFNRQTSSFKRIYAEDSIYVRAVLEDTLTGNLYVGIKNKIMIFDADKGILKEKDAFKMDSELGNINSFFQSDDRAIWIGHSKGLARFNSSLNTIKYYQPKQSLHYARLNDIGPLVEDERGLIWAGGFWHNEGNQGLVCFDPENEQFRMYKFDPNVQNCISGNFVSSVYKDQSGIIWVGTWLKGLNKWDRKKQKFKRYRYDSTNPQKNKFNSVYSISEDSTGDIWFTTDEWLYSFNRKSNRFNHYKFDAKKNGTSALYIENSETIWFGADAGGLAKFNRFKGSFKFYSHDAEDSTTISSNTLIQIIPDGKDILWLATPKGVNKFDKKTEKFKRYKHDPDNSKSISNNVILCIYKDSKETIWIGTNLGGLNSFVLDDESFKCFSVEGEKFTTIEAIYEDHRGNFWVGTYQFGIYLFDRERGELVYNISVKDGLPNNFIRSILEDDSGNLWIGTVNGLMKFNLETHIVKNYFGSDDFDENRYTRAFKTSDGEMLFGTGDGFIIFHPDSVKDDPDPPQIVINNVSLFNRPGKNLEYDGFISEMKELNLSYNENDLRFDYVGLHYGEPKKNRYKYMLEGHDDDWVDAGIQRNATYTNLDAGEYVFRVTACNRDGVWDEKGASIIIIIPPPFWATWWAYGFYIIFFGSVLYGIRRYEMNRLNWKNQFKLDEVKLKEREETDKLKSRFFANISHEFRTPLTLIKGPAEKINRNSSGEEIEKQTSVIKRNADRLLDLINQLLDLSKLEAGKLELRASNSNIVPFIKGITMSFESVAEKKDITLKVKSEKEEIELYFDKEKMTKIITNLLSNAFKFTNDGGQITVTINEIDNSRVRIKVKDTGQGISEEELPKLFDRFYQVDSSQTRKHEGTGIGLALTKELVELHDGTISVDSILGAWTEFTIELPLGRKHLKDEEIVEGETDSTVIRNSDKVGGKNLNDFETVDSSSQDPQDDKIMDEDKNIVLIVEDNADVREFIKDSLGNEFHIEEAANGEQGVRKAEQIIPDLIISDVMMPKMDGNELTKRLKNDEKTSHIPIILLTAKSEQESKLEGLETGADEYLTKPFDTKELLTRIKNLIRIRKKLQEKFRIADYSFPHTQENKERKLSNLEENFMNKVSEVMGNNFAKEEFSIERFSKEVGMSRVQLHRKLKALSGKSASHYLRSFRLNKAKQMITEQKENISEIAYSVGFSSPAYFTRCFKEEFGYPPSDLVE